MFFFCFSSPPPPQCYSSKFPSLYSPQVNRANDIYVAVIAHDHQVCAANKWIAIVSTNVETTDAESELEPGFKLLGAIEEKWADFYRLPNAVFLYQNICLTKQVCVD